MQRWIFFRDALRRALLWVRLASGEVFRREAVRFDVEVAFRLRVLVFFLLAVRVADFVLALAGFFLRSVPFALCAFWAADARDCSDAWDKGVMDNDVNSKAQSVIETLFIRATEHSSANQAIFLRLVGD